MESLLYTSDTTTPLDRDSQHTAHSPTVGHRAVQDQIALLQQDCADIVAQAELAVSRAAVREDALEGKLAAADADLNLLITGQQRVLGDLREELYEAHDRAAELEDLNAELGAQSDAVSDLQLELDAAQVELDTCLSCLAGFVDLVLLTWFC